jgi:Uma2 family endonuclease
MVLRSRNLDLSTHLYAAPDWVAEVLSPHNTAHDLRTKRRIYERAQIPEYWIVNPESRQVLVLRLGANGTYAEPETFGATDSIQSQAIAGFVLDSARLFSALD